MNFGRHIILRFYKTHNLASKSFLFNKETLVEIFFASVFGKLKCDSRCLHFWHNCCFLESSVSLILLMMSSLEEGPSYKIPSSPVGRMQSDLASELFLINKEAEVDFFFEAVFGKSKCDCPKRYFHFENYFPPQTKNWHNCITVLYNKYICNTKNYFLPEPKKLTQHHNCIVL
jgi:hypothetical protein